MPLEITKVMMRTSGIRVATPALVMMAVAIRSRAARVPWAERTTSQ